MSIFLSIIAIIISSLALLLSYDSAKQHIRNKWQCRGRIARVLSCIVVLKIVSFFDKDKKSKLRKYQAELRSIDDVDITIG